MDLGLSASWTGGKSFRLTLKRPLLTASVQCGSNTCTGGDICLTTHQPPQCEDKLNPSDPCPTDKPNDTLCGGAGMACCCEDTPPPLYECDAAAQCGAQVTCECLGDICGPDLSCMNGAEPGSFSCEELPRP